MGVVIENSWLCMGRKYRYLMVHEFQGKDDSKATIRVHLMNAKALLKLECQKYIDTTKNRSHSIVIESKPVETELDMSLGATIVEYTCTRESYFKMDIFTMSQDQRDKKDHTNCMRFATAISERFKLPMNEEFLGAHGEVIAAHMKKLPVHPELKVMDSIELARAI